MTACHAVGTVWKRWHQSRVHTLRHTYASLQLAGGANVVQLSRALGHHSASFTLDVYVHLLEGEEVPALDLAEALGRGNVRGNASDRTGPNSLEAELAELAT